MSKQVRLSAISDEDLWDYFDTLIDEPGKLQKEMVRVSRARYAVLTELRNRGVSWNAMAARPGHSATVDTIKRMVRHQRRRQEKE